MSNGFSFALNRYWYTAKEACALKGVSYNTLRKPENRHLLPAYGRPTEVLRAGRCREMYSVSEVADWLPKTEEEIERELQEGEVMRDGRIHFN